MKITTNKSIELSRSATVDIAAPVSATIVLKGSGTYTIRVARRAQLQVVEMVKTRSLVQHITIELAGIEASAVMIAGFLGNRTSRHELNVTMHHQAKATTGDILIKGVYAEQSRGTFRGLIKIDRRAEQSNSYFTDNVLLLDEGMATSIPTLEIEEHDVKASHGSTTSRVDTDQLFYLMSRGVAPAQARDMITNGFLQPIFNRLQTI